VATALTKVSFAVQRLGRAHAHVLLPGSEGEPAGEARDWRWAASYPAWGVTGFVPSSGDLPTQEFVDRYLGEYDRRYVEGAVPVDPEFIQAVEWGLSAIGGWALGKALDPVYDRVKKRVIARFAQRKGAAKDIRIVGPHPAKGVAILEFGSVRPAFHIQKGHRLILSDVIIRYVGAPTGLIKEDVAPSFIPTRVSFVQAKNRSRGVGLYHINCPIWVGAKGENPYDMRDRGGSVVVYDMTETEARGKGLQNYILVRAE
jgi:hypothetical protein